MLICLDGCGWRNNLSSPFFSSPPEMPLPPSGLSQLNGFFQSLSARSSVGGPCSTRARSSDAYISTSRAPIREPICLKVGPLEVHGPSFSRSGSRQGLPVLILQRQAPIWELYLMRVLTCIELPIFRRAFYRLYSLSVPLLPFRQPSKAPHLYHALARGNQCRVGASGVAQPYAF